MLLGEALDGTGEAQPSDVEALRVQLGRLLHQSGIWELRLNHGRGSATAYNRHAISGVVSGPVPPLLVPYQPRVEAPRHSLPLAAERPQSDDTAPSAANRPEPASAS
jgi:hypothetical protein